VASSPRLDRISQILIDNKSEYEGKFDGTYIDAHDFKGVNEDWRTKNVLVFGAVNSGCNVAVESARIAGKVCISMRSPNGSCRNSYLANRQMFLLL